MTSPRPSDYAWTIWRRGRRTRCAAARRFSHATPGDAARSTADGFWRRDHRQSGNRQAIPGRIDDNRLVRQCAGLAKGGSGSDTRRLQNRIVFAARIDREPAGGGRMTDFQTAQLGARGSGLDQAWRTRRPGRWSQYLSRTAPAIPPLPCRHVRHNGTEAKV